MRVRVYSDEKNTKFYLELSNQEVEKYRKWLIWFIATSLPLLVSYATAINFLPPEQLPPSPPNNQEELRK